MPLPSFTVTGNLFEITGAVDVGELSEIPAQYAYATFTPNFRYAENPIVFGGNIEWVKRVELTADGNGQIDGRLLANDPGLNIVNLRWRCDIRLRIGGAASFWFDAPADGATVDLADVVPAPAVAGGDGAGGGVIDGGSP